MTTKEKEIQDYLISHNYSVDTQDFIAKILNCNYEIENIGYNTNTDMKIIGEVEAVCYS